jgi:Txe/YoeB family toxin of Txe-Axe toxin-antitoxin module
MKETPYTQMANEVIDLKLKAVDAVIEEVIDPIKDIGNPEKLLGKKYEEWSPAERQLLLRIYGTEDSPLRKLIFKKQYEEVKELEDRIKGLRGAR